MAWLFVNQYRGMLPFGPKPYQCDDTGLFALPGLRANNLHCEGDNEECFLPHMTFASVLVLNEINDWVLPRTRAHHLLLDGFGSLNIEKCIARNGCVGIYDSFRVMSYGAKVMFWVFWNINTNTFYLHRSRSTCHLLHASARDCATISLK